MKNQSHIKISIFLILLFSNPVFSQTLTKFGEIFTTSSSYIESKNSELIKSLERKALASPEKYGEKLKIAQEVNNISETFHLYLKTLKKEMCNTVDAPTDYAVMDKSDYLDKVFFNGDKLAPGGKEFIRQINTYRNKVKKVISKVEKIETINKDINRNFNPEDVSDREGNPTSWLNYHFKGFPLIASLTKLSAMQSDIRIIETSILTQLLR